MFVYATLMLGKFNCVHQRSGLAVAGFMGVIMGIVVSYGICSAFGVFFGPMHSVLPFLLLGIGLDDMFVIAQSWDSLEIGQAHDMFSRIFRIRIFFYEILCNICFDFLEFPKLRKEYAFLDQ